MELLVSHLILSIVVGLAGLCAGWWFHALVPEKRTFVGQDDEGLIRELLSSLHSLSVRVAADVDDHNNTVGAVDRELGQVQEPTVSNVGPLVDRLIQANREVQSKLSQTEGKLDDLSTKMEFHASEARTDVLTGLANRRAFQEEAARIHAKFCEAGEEFSLIMVDIDRFKQVNDAHGHPFGDEVLRGLGEVLLDQFRGRDVVTRYGGEEFAILLPTTGIAEARRMAENVRDVVEKTRFAHSGKTLGLTVSLGVAEVLMQEQLPELLKRADQAMYAAKHSGRNRVYWHDGTLPHPVRAPRHRTSEEESCEATVSPLREASAEPLVVAGHVAPQLPDDVVVISHDDVPRALQAADVDMEVLHNMGNKTMFCQNVHRRIAEFNRGGSPFSTILLSIDRCEELTRAYGEQAWKLVIGVVAEAIRRRLREMDLVARYDDKSFGMVLPDASLRNAICIGERLRKCVQRMSVDFEGQTLRVTVSLGIVEVQDGDEMATLVERAREQLGQAQDGGGNRTGFSAGALVAS